MFTINKPTAVWWLDQGCLYVRFENIADKGIFGDVVEKFKRKIANRGAWQPEKKAWRLPITEMQSLALFAHDVLGDDSLQPRDVNPHAYQPKLL